MNEENKENLKVEVIIVPNTKNVAGYKTKSNTYVFANHIDNIRSIKYNKLENLNGLETTINLIYVSSKKIKEKSLVGFFVGNVAYLNEIYKPSVIYNTKIYIMKKQLMTTGFSYAKPNDEMALNFNKAMENAKLSCTQKKELENVTYNKTNMYKLHLVFNKIHTIAIRCIIDGKTFVFVNNIDEENKKNILDLGVGSNVQMKAMVRENNIVGFVLCDAIFIKAPCYAKGEYDELISQKPDCDINAHVAIVENNIKPIVLVSSEEQATVTFSETNLAYESNAETTSLADGYDTDLETNLAAAKNDFQTKTKRPTYDTKNHEDIEATRLTDSSVENLQELNSRHCNIL